MRTVMISSWTHKYCDIQFPGSVSDEVDAIVLDATWGECEDTFNDLCNLMELKLEEDDEE